MLFGTHRQTSAPIGQPFSLRALQLSAAASKRLTLSFPNAPTNLKKQTFSCFVRLAAYPAGTEYLFSQFTAGSAYGLWAVNAAGQLLFQQDNDGATSKSAFITASAAIPLNQPVHLHVAFDSTLPTEADRLIVSINRMRVGGFSSFAAPWLNYEAEWFGTQRLHEVGAHAGGGYWNGPIDEFAFVDGAALPAENFATADARARDLFGTAWGNNGFWLRFENPASLGFDSSGRGNHFTAENIVTADSIVAFA
jgi:hypothetical protein